MKIPPTPRTRRRRRGGFTLIEVVVVLLIFAVIVGMAAMITRGVAAAQKRSLTATRIATVDAALVQYAMQQKRLPCPADGTLASTAANAGVEGARNANAGCTGTQQNGVVPWRALALTEDEATDGWGRRLTYRAAAILASDGGMDMSWCDPAGTEAAPATAGKCTPGCTALTLAACTPPSMILNGRGLEVRTVAGIVVMNPAAVPPSGAAYVVVSHGETGGGGYLNTGSLYASTVTDGTEEAKNYANLGLQAYYLDDSISDVSGATHFDDIVSRPSVLAVVSKAGLGPRSHQ